VSRATPRTAGAPLEYETVIDEARRLIAERGFEGLTMRRLAERCGVTAMSLYRHVNTKEELLAILADRLLDDLDVPDLTGLSWQDEVAAVFRALHRMWLAHPEFGQIAATQPVDGAVAHRWMERVLAALERAGLTGDQVVDAYDALASYTTGSIQQHAGEKVRAVPAGTRVKRMQGLPEDDYPHVRALADRLVDRSPEEHFEAGLSIILRGISARAETMES
jgi:TetR/AcrR family transcriptional regulator, tetracycline repressor protein